MKKCKNCKYYHKTGESSISMAFVDPDLKEPHFDMVLSGRIIPEGGIKACAHSSCFEVKHKYDPVYGYKFWKERIAGQAQLNPDGNCKYYKRKWWKFWV